MEALPQKSLVSHPWDADLCAGAVGCFSAGLSFFHWWDWRQYLLSM